MPNSEPVIDGATRDPVTVNPFLKFPDPDTSNPYTGLTTLIPILPFDGVDEGVPVVVECDPVPNIIPPMLILSLAKIGSVIFVPITMLFEVILLNPPVPPYPAL